MIDPTDLTDKELEREIEARKPAWIKVLEEEAEWCFLMDEQLKREKQKLEK